MNSFNSNEITNDFELKKLNNTINQSNSKEPFIIKQIQYSKFFRRKEITEDYVYSSIIPLGLSIVDWQILDKVKDNFFLIKLDQAYVAKKTSFLRLLNVESIFDAFGFIIVIFIISIISNRVTIKKQKINLSRTNEDLVMIINYISQLEENYEKEDLFEVFVNQIKVLLNDDEINVISIIKNNSNYYINEGNFLVKQFKSFFGINIDNFEGIGINSKKLDEISFIEDQIVISDHYIIIKLFTDHLCDEFLYIGSSNTIIASKTLKIYLNIMLLRLKNARINSKRENDRIKLFAFLGELIEKREESVANHVARVSEATEYLAVRCGYDQNSLNHLRIASSIHDVGKIKVPDSILNKPGKLTDEEFEIIKKHATDEFKVINNKLSIKLSEIIHNVVRYHHENWDGSGYPDGIRQENIPYEARLVSIIDVFEALVHERKYKDAWSYEEAIEFIKSQRGKKFDPEIVDVFLKNSLEIYNIFKKYQNDYE